MKTLYLLLIIFLFLTTTTWGQLITSDNFNYTDNALLTDNGWIAHSGSGTNPVAVGSSNGLSYAGYSGLSGVTGAVEGNAARLVNTGEDVSLLFTTVNSGTIYFSFLTKVTVGTSGYYLHLGKNATTFAARFFVKPSTTGKVNFGISNTSTGSYATTPTDFSVGTTYLIIIKYDVSTTGAASLWVKESGVPTSELLAGTPEHTTSGTGQIDINRICLRQYDTSQRMEVDGIRVAQTWASLLPATGVNQPPSITNLSRVTFVPPTGGTDSVKANITDDGVITSAKLHVRVNGGAYDSTFTMSVLSGSTYFAVIPAGKHVTNGDLVEYFVSAIDDSSAYTSTASSLQGYFVGESPISSIKSYSLNSVAGYGARLNGTLNVGSNILSSGSTYIQDGTGGMRLYLSGMVFLNEGRNAKVEGTVAARFNAFQLTTPNFSFVDTSLGTSTITPVAITLPTTQSAANTNEGRIVKILGMSTDSTGTYAAGKIYIYREADNDTISVYIESSGSANTIVGKAIPTTPVDAVGVLAFYNSFMELKPRRAEDFGISGGDGSGTATIKPTTQLINQTAVSETLTITGNDVNTLEGVSVQIPSTWTWTNTSSYTLSGSGFSGASPSFTGDGSTGNPYVITITGAAVTNINTGILRIFNLNTPSSTGITTFTTKTRESGGVLTPILTSPTVNITALTFEAIATGNWNNPATWSSSIVPSASDNVTFTTKNVVVTVTANAQCANLTMTGIDTTGGAVGPVLKFDPASAVSLTVNGRLDISGSVGRPQLTSNGNINAILILKGYIYTNVSNTIANGNRGLNMNEGYVQIIGNSTDSLRTGAGFRLANLTIGDGVGAKNLIWVQTSSATMNVRSLTIKSGSSLTLGGTTQAQANSIGNASTIGVPMLTGGVTIENNASLIVNNASSPGQVANINIKSGGLTNNGILNLISANTSRKYNVAFGGLTADTSAVKQTVSGDSIGSFANVTVGRTDTQLDTLFINRSMKVDTMTVWDRIVESTGNSVVGLVQTTRDVKQGINNDFGGIGVEVNAVDAAPGSTVVSRLTGVAQSGGGNSSILRSFDISPTVNTGLNAAFVFHYDTGELAGQNEATLTLWKTTDEGTTWSFEAGSVDVDLNEILLSGVNSFSLWTASDASHPLSGVTCSYTMNNRWNMISVPLTVTDYTKTVLFPTAISQAYTYASGYQSRNTLENGVGYWLKFPSAQEVEMSGSVRTLDTIDVTQGWNMIGSISDSVLTSTIQRIPTEMTVSTVYGYSGSYVASNVIYPAKGYWIKTNMTGKLVLSTTGLSKNTQSSLEMLKCLNKLIISDGEGNSQTLYFGENTDNKFSIQSYELPPIPPNGIFDVRFGFHNYVETFSTSESATKDYPIMIQASKYPVTISWEISKGDKISYVLEIIAENSSLSTQELNAQGEIILSKQNSNSLILRVVNISQLPKVYSLSDNYPNPFNPSTRLTISLPVDADVEISVFDILGRKVKTLLNERKSAGYHHVEWNGRDENEQVIGSGMYIIRMLCNDFVALRKVMMMK